MLRSARCCMLVVGGFVSHGSPPVASLVLRCDTCLAGHGLRRAPLKLRTVVRSILAMTASLADVLAAISPETPSSGTRCRARRNECRSRFAAVVHDDGVVAVQKNQAAASAGVGGCSECEAAQGLSWQRCATVTPRLRAQIGSGSTRAGRRALSFRRRSRRGTRGPQVLMPSLLGPRRPAHGSAHGLWHVSRARGWRAHFGPVGSTQRAPQSRAAVGRVVTWRVGNRPNSASSGPL